MNPTGADRDRPLLTRLLWCGVALLALALIAPAAASASRAHYFAGRRIATESGDGLLSLKASPAGSGIAVNEETGDLYVADTGNHRVVEFTSAGAFVRTWGWGVQDGAAEFQVCSSGCQAGISSSQPGGFEAPLYVAVDNSDGPSKGDVYVGEELGTVSKFGPSGDIVSAWGSSGQLSAVPAASGSGDLSPSVATGTGRVVSEQSSTMDHVVTTSGEFSAGQLLQLPGHGGFGVEEIVAVGPGTITVEQPWGCCFSGAEELLAEKTTVSSLQTVSGSFGAGQVVTGPGIPSGTRILEASPTTLRLSKAVSAPLSGASLSTAPIPFKPLAGLAVDSDGHLSVLDQNEKYSFDPAGGYLGTVGIMASLQTLAVPAGLAIDAGGFFYFEDSLEALRKATPGGTGVHGGLLVHEGSLILQPRNGGRAVTGLAVDRLHGDLYVDLAGESIVDLSSRCDPAVGFCIPTQEFGEGDLSEAAGLAIDSPSGTVYAADAGSNSILTFPVAIEALVDPATAVAATTATLNGRVDPYGSELTSCRFTYAESGSEEQTSAPCAEATAAIGSGQALVPVHADVAGLAGGTTYSYRLHGVNANGSVVSESGQFSTSPDPFIGEAAAREITAESAELTARINPRGSSTSYHFEYGPCVSASSCSTSPFPQRVPLQQDEGIGAGSAEVAVSAQITGLSATTTYHFRVVATNGSGTTTGAEHTFVYLPGAPSGQACANEAVREATGSTHLPDCRAYELVTPARKNGSLIGANFAEAMSEPEIAGDGSSMIVSAIQCFAATPSCTGSRSSQGEPYELSRTASGWASTPLAPPPTARESTWYDFSADEHTALFSYQDAAGIEHFYYRDPSGSFHDLGPFGAQSADFSAINGIRSTPNMDHVLFGSSHPFWPFDHSREASLYEYVGEGNDQPLLVGVKGGFQSNSLVSTCNTGAGGANPMSLDGRTVLFQAGRCTAEENEGVEIPVSEIFARVDGEEEGAHTVAISEPAAFGPPPQRPSCSSAACKQNTTEPSRFRGATALDLSLDGSRAFFTSRQQLTDDAAESREEKFTPCAEPTGEAGCNLYMYDFSRPADDRLTDISAGDSSGIGPRVQGVLAISRDGTHVYFVARGMLTGPNSQGAVPLEGGNNLYLYERDAEHPAGRTVFIAALASGAALQGPNGKSTFEETQWNESFQRFANVTEDGRFLLFTSHRGLTADAKKGAGGEQVYRYDAKTETLTRISIGQRGFNDNGNAGRGNARIVLPWGATFRGNVAATKNPSMSDDGSRVFFESPVALAPGALDDVTVDSEGRLAENVYEWEANGSGGCAEPSGCVYLLSDGTDTGAAPTTVRSSTELLGTDSSGENVFFATASALTPEDPDTQRDYYDARIGGGFPQPPAPLPCQGDACKGEGSAPAPQSTPATSAFSGPEEGPHHPQKPHRGKHKHKKHKHRHSAHHHGGAKKGGRR